jgi:ParB/RepB/Spo0J family partition protein
MSAPAWKDLLRRAQQAMANAKEVRVSPAAIRPMPGQPRVHFDAASLTRLAESMCAIGQLYPGIVRAVPRDGAVHYELLDGERRWRAAKAAKLQYRALVVRVDDESARYIIAATANFNRESHTPIEVSNAIESMLTIGMPMEEIASILGIHPIWAYEIHALQKLAPEVAALMDPTLPLRKRLPTTAAIEIAKVHASLQPRLAQRVLSRSLKISAVRDEAVRASHAAGLPVRERTIGKNKRWLSVVAKADLFEKHTADLDRLVHLMGDYVGERTPAEVRRLVERLQGITSRLSTAADVLARFHQRKAS